MDRDSGYTDIAANVDYECYQLYKCDTPCGLGQEYKTSCSGVVITYGNPVNPAFVLCGACAAGKYRSNVQTQPACAACTTCQSNQKRTVECSATANRQCETCGPGFIVVGGTECVSCNSDRYPGTYANAAQTACVGCQNCGVFQRMTSDCSRTQDRQCANCGPNQRALSTNAGSCEGCNQFYVRGENGCAVCNGENAACNAGYWINCQFSSAAGGYRTCEVCMGQADVVAPGSNQLCAEGFGVAKRCRGTDTEKTMCVPCAKGTERRANTPLVDGLYQGCAKCGTGKFKTEDTSALCGDCSNKPAGNSVYDVWPSNQAASTANCPWICNAGFLKSGDSCVRCSTGTYSTTAGATVCSPCTNKPVSNTYYLARLATNIPDDNECPWECNIGYERQGSTCSMCQNGKYRDVSVTTEGSVNQCVPCSECQAQIPPDAAGRNGVQGTYMTEECVFNRNRVCGACNVACSAGSYIRNRCNTTHNLDCAPCVTKCPAGFYLSSQQCGGSAGYDEVLAACIPCLTFANCTGDYYLSGACTGSERVINTCLSCNKNQICPPGQYRQACSGFTDTTCQPYRTCAGGEYLSDESLDRDGVCRPCSLCGGLTLVVGCTRYDDTVCRGSSSCSDRLPCPRLMSTNRSALFCDYSLGPERATCGICPPGYGSDGQYCLECPRGYTCDRVGEPICRGQCQAGVLSACDFEFGLGYAQCGLSWQACETVYSNSRRPWRGTYTEAEDGDCGAYFLCVAGSYKNFSTGGTVSCEPCDASLLPSRGALDRFVTEGLSAEDDASCLWECRHDLAAPHPETGLCVAKSGRERGFLWNAAGWWTSSGGASEVCGEGLTSQEGTAMLKSECLACQPLPPGDVMRWRPRTTQCEFVCLQRSDTKRGSKCVRAQACVNAEGLVVAGGACSLQAFPWNRPGYEKVGLSVQVGAWNPSSTPPPYPRTSSLKHGVRARHTVTATAGAVPRTVEGPLCSSTVGTVGGRRYVFGAPCNQSFLVYLDLERAGSGLGVLIGNGTRGWRDGFRTQALFESELYVAGTGGGTLFVLDRWNCLLREVVVWDRPGSYLTRVYTLWGDTSKLALAVPEAKCYGEGSLAWPRRFWPLLGADDWLAFGDEDGLWQFNVATYELLAMIKEDEGSFEVDNIANVSLPDPGDLKLWFQDGALWTVQAQQQPCPVDTTSLFGGSCTVVCKWRNSAQEPSQYVDPATGQCRACTLPVCGRGRELVPCAPRLDAYCGACEFGEDPACSACPSARVEGSGTCLRCSIDAITVAGSPELFADIPGASVYRFRASGSIRFARDTRADVLLIGGGGAGGTAIGGGGGAGTLVLGMSALLAGGVSYSVVVGAGGVRSSLSGAGGSGQASSIGSLISAAGGGGGGAWSTFPAANGGSGGGAGACRSFPCPGGTAPSSSNLFARAYAGGSGATSNSGTGYKNYLLHGGGGGGAGTPGENDVTGDLASCSPTSPTSCGTCGAGGTGLKSLTVSGAVYSFEGIFGGAYTGVASSGLVAAGGGGGAFGGSAITFTSNTCPGGVGGGGTGYRGSINIGTAASGNGLANTGSGGGGGADSQMGGNGGSGLVLIKLHGDILAQGGQFCACQARSNLLYTEEGTCDAGTLRPIPPCESGWYASGTSPGYCVPCPAYTATLYGGATRPEQCRCLDGLVRRNGACVGEGLYEFDGACADQAACTVPGNAHLLAWAGHGCRWACNAGYYRDRLAGFLDQCRPCRIGLGRTSGDDDEPWSCE